MVAGLPQNVAGPLAARTGKELTAPLADLPPDNAPATALEPARRVLATRIAIGASAAGATALAAVAATNALSNSPGLQKRELAQEVLARLGTSIRVPTGPGFDWAGTLTPGAIAVLLVVLIIVLRVTRPGRI